MKKYEAVSQFSGWIEDWQFGCMSEKPDVQIWVQARKPFTIRTERKAPISMQLRTLDDKPHLVSFNEIDEAADSTQ